MRILRLPEVKALTGHRSHVSIYNAIHAGLFTKQVQIGQRSVGWPAHEVETINRARIAGKTEIEIRRLVEELHALRLDTGSSQALTPLSKAGVCSSMLTTEDSSSASARSVQRFTSTVSKGREFFVEVQDQNERCTSAIQPLDEVGGGLNV